MFLKHHFGAGYTLSFEGTESFNVASVIESATRLPVERHGFNEWQLKHGTESSFSETLTALSTAGATNVSLELTTLEQVFLATGKEEEEHNAEEEEDDADENSEAEDFDSENPEQKADQLEKIWKRKGSINTLSFLRKFLLVQHFMMTNAWKIKGTIFLNIGMPVSSCCER